MAREYFCAYHSLLDTMESLNDAERGRLFTACLIYSKTGESSELRGNERFVFPGIRSQIDRDSDKYKLNCKKQSENARMRWHAAACERMPNDAKHANKKEKTKTKEKTNEKEIKQSRACAQEVFVSYAGKDADLLAALNSFAEMRKQLKKPMTEHAKKLLIAELNKLAMDNPTKIELLNQSVLHGWQSVYPLKSNQTVKQNSGNPFLDMLREEERRG